MDVIDISSSDKDDDDSFSISSLIDNSQEEDESLEVNQPLTSSSQSEVASSSLNLDRRILPPTILQGRSGNKERSREFCNVPLGPRCNKDPTRNRRMNEDFDAGKEDIYIWQERDLGKPIGSYDVSSHPTGKFDVGSSHNMDGRITREFPYGQNYNTASRVLPSWCGGRNSTGRYAVNPQFFGMNNGREHVVDTEPGYVDHDERLIYDAVLKDLAQPKTELELEDGLLSVSLLRHQKIALAWMEQKERTSHPCSGGILADDQGLGKTVSMIALILKQIPLQKKFMSSQSIDRKLETWNLDDDENAKSYEIKPGNLSLADEGCLTSVDKSPKTLKLGSNGNTDFGISKKYAGGDSNATFNNTSTSACKGRTAGGTLVVCPASILRQWARELDEKIASGAKLSVQIYHGSSRTKHSSELAKFDVVITTYAIITNEVPKLPVGANDSIDQRNPTDYGLTPDFSTDRKRKAYHHGANKKKKKGKATDLDHDAGPLSKVRWFRIILDEAQVIKNHRTQVARACCGLRAKTRWCLSGTPLQNAVEDLYSYFRFLKYDPYAKYSSFCSALKYPLVRDSVTGYKKLQAVLRAIMLRRTKDTKIDGKPVFELPAKFISLEKLCFSVDERNLYSSLEAKFRDRFKAYASEGTVKQNYANILIMLLRLRQACNHPFLVKEHDSDHPFLVKEHDSDSSSNMAVDVLRKLPTEKIKHLLNKLNAASAICVYCNDSPEDAVVTICGHVFCYQCISDCIVGEGTGLCSAPGCYVTLDSNSHFSRATLRYCIPYEHDTSMVPTSCFEQPKVERNICNKSFLSTKIKAALEILISIQSRNCSRFASGKVEHTLVASSSATSSISACNNSTIQMQEELPLKAIVFSQWISMLDLLESSLKANLIPFRRLDGSMSLASRDQAVKKFNTDPEVTVMIMSLKSGYLGLNMVAACHVILLDLWWNPTSEDQAVDRAHRIGQTRPVSVHRLTIKDTVEERILKIQENKREMVSSAFGEDTSGRKAASRLTMEDLRFLFQV